MRKLVNTKIEYCNGKPDDLIMTFINEYDISCIDYILIFDLMTIVKSYADDQIDVYCNIFDYRLRSEEIDVDIFFNYERVYYDTLIYTNHRFANTTMRVIADILCISKYRCGINLFIPHFSILQMMNDYMLYRYGLTNYVLKNTFSYSFVDDICIYKGDKEVVVIIIKDLDKLVLIMHVIRKILDWFHAHL